jgi:hypothetical protein
MTDFAQTGFALIPLVLSPSECTDLAQRISALPLQGVGSRNLLAESFCTELGHKLLNHALLRTYLEHKSTCALVPVQCTYFAKSSQANWLVPVHQDLRIPVAGRFAHAGWASRHLRRLQATARATCPRCGR